MQTRGSMREQGLAMNRCAIPGMPLKPVIRKLLREAANQSISRFLRQHTGGSNGSTAAVAPHNRLLGMGPQTQRKNPVHQQQIRSGWQALQRPQHGELGGSSDAMTIDFSGGGLAQRPGLRSLLNQRHQPGPTPGCQRFAVGQALLTQSACSVIGKHHHTGEDRSKPAAATHLINSGLQRVLPSFNNCLLLCQGDAALVGDGR